MFKGLRGSQAVKSLPQKKKKMATKLFKVKVRYFKKKKYLFAKIPFNLIQLLTNNTVKIQNSSHGLIFFKGPSWWTYTRGGGTYMQINTDHLHVCVAFRCWFPCSYTKCKLKLNGLIFKGTHFRDKSKIRKSMGLYSREFMNGKGSFLGCYNKANM